MFVFIVFYNIHLPRKDDLFPFSPAVYLGQSAKNGMWQPACFFYGAAWFFIMFLFSPCAMPLCITSHYVCRTHCHNWCENTCNIYEVQYIHLTTRRMLILVLFLARSRRIRHTISGYLYLGNIVWCGWDGCCSWVSRRSASADR